MTDSPAPLAPDEAPPRLSRRPTDLTAALAALIGVALLVGAPTTWWLTRPPTTVGEMPAPVVAELPRPVVEPEPEPVVEVVTMAAPVAIRVGAIGVDAVVVPVGLEDDGAMEIPVDVATIGWYDPADWGGVRPGEPGTAVLSGHVDSRSQGRGAFYDLRALDVDDTIEIVHDDGTVSRWVVTGRTSYDKKGLPFAEIFTWSGDARIALITCGGPFDRTARSYLENIVVLARPA